MLALTLLLDGLGELVGYVTGPGGAARILGEIEFNRVRFMNESDRREFLAAGSHLDSPDTTNVSTVQALAG